MRKRGGGGSVRLSYGQFPCNCEAQEEHACKLALGRAEGDAYMARTGQGTVRFADQNQHSGVAVDGDRGVYHDYEAVLVEDACSVRDCVGRGSDSQAGACDVEDDGSVSLFHDTGRYRNACAGGRL